VLCCCGLAVGRDAWQSFYVPLEMQPSHADLERFCCNHGIKSLRLFGSAARLDFDPEQSDVDLLVEYEEGKHPGLDHFKVADELSEIFGRKVDLNTLAMLGRFGSGVMKDSTGLYAKA